MKTNETTTLEMMDLRASGHVAMVDLWYPRNSPLKTIQVGLMDVRAADDIRVTYDFDRDGWSILQASIFEWEATDSENDQDWQEVAFIKAWAREVKGE